MTVSGVAGFASRGLLAELSGNAGVISQKLTQVGEEVSTGLVSTTYAGLGSGALTSLNLRPQMAQNDAISDGIGAATSQMGVTQTAMTQIGALAQGVLAKLSAAGGTGTGANGLDEIAAQARDAFNSVVSLLNTKDGDSYVFAGEDSANPPVGSTAGFLAGVTGAVQGLGTPGTTLAATEAGSLGAGTSGVFSTAAGQSTVQTMQTGQGTPVPYGVLAGSSYMRQILQSLATIGALGSSQTGAAGYSAFVQDATKQLGAASTALTADQGVLGERQGELTATQTTLASTKISLATQLSGVEDADVAALATTQSLLQTQLQTSYKLISNMQNLSLVQYL